MVDELILLFFKELGIVLLKFNLITALVFYTMYEFLKAV